MAGVIRSVTDWAGLTSETPELGKMAGETLTPSTQDANALYQQALEQAKQAAIMQGASPVRAEEIAAQQVNPQQYGVHTDVYAKAADATLRTQGYSAAEAAAANYTGQLTAADVTTAKNVTPIGTADVSTGVQAGAIGDAAQTDLVGVGGTTVGGVQLSGKADAVRDESLAAAREIADSPSAAMSQFQAGQSQVVRDQLAMAERARGAERAGARREAIIAAGQQGAQGNLAASALSAQEEQAKRAAAYAALSGVRSQDTTTATTQAQLDQARATQQAQIDSQRAQLQAQLDSAIAQGNTAAINAIKTQQAQLDLDARKSTVSAGLDLAKTNADIEKANLLARQQTEITNAGALTKAQADYKTQVADMTRQAMTDATKISEANALAKDKAASDAAAAKNEAARQAALLETQTNQKNAELAAQQARENADRAAAAEKMNIENKMKADAANALNKLTADTTNATNTLQGERQKAEAGTNAINAGTSAAGVEAGNAKAAIGAQAAEAGMDAQQAGAIMSAAGAVGASYAGSPSKPSTPAGTTSDERVKRDIAPVGGGDIYSREEPDSGDIYAGTNYEEGKRKIGDEEDKRAVEQMSPDDIYAWAARQNPIAYKYKDGVEDNGENVQLGLSAQQEEKAGPLGRLMTYEDPDGTKSIDYQAALLMLGKAAFDRANDAYELAMKRGR